MKIEYDPTKSDKNQHERGFSFALANEFELDTAVIRIDIRKQYDEPRFNAIGYIGLRLYHMTFTVRVDVIRIISLRKSNKREVNRYANT